MPKLRVRRHEVVQPLDDSYRLIPLTQEQNTLVDSSDYEWLNQWNWHAQWNGCTHSFYARRNIKTEKGYTGVEMSHEILRQKADHISHDTLDNRRNNLRGCNFSQNMMNKRGYHNGVSKFKGVYWRGDLQKWAASIQFNKKRIFLGVFSFEQQASNAYDKAAKEYHGEFAHTNREATEVTPPLEKSSDAC